MRLPSRPTRSMKWIGISGLASVMLIATMSLIAIDWLQATANGQNCILIYDFLGIDDERQLPHRVTIDVRRDGALEVAGHPVATNDLDTFLRERVAVSTGNLEVQIRGAREVQFRHVAHVMAACGRIGIWNVSIDTN